MQETDILNRLADIQLAEPPEGGHWWLLVVGLLLILAMIVLQFWRRHGRKHAGKSNDGKSNNRKANPPDPSPRKTARDRLQQLELEWMAGAIDDRAAAYRIVALLRYGRQLRQGYDILSHGDDTDIRLWATLNRLRYTRSPDTPLDLQVFRDAALYLDETSKPPC